MGILIRGGRVVDAAAQIDKIRLLMINFIINVTGVSLF